MGVVYEVGDDVADLLGPFVREKGGCVEQQAIAAAYTDASLGRISATEFWQRVGGGDSDYDVKVGEACEAMCAEFRENLSATLIPQLVKRLTEAARPLIGDDKGRIAYTKLFRQVNK